jgi:hypothetical protein
VLSVCVHVGGVTVASFHRCCLVLQGPGQADRQPVLAQPKRHKAQFEPAVSVTIVAAMNEIGAQTTLFLRESDQPISHDDHSTRARVQSASHTSIRRSERDTHTHRSFGEQASASFRASSARMLKETNKSHRSLIDLLWWELNERRSENDVAR